MNPPGLSQSVANPTRNRLTINGLAGPTGTPMGAVAVVEMSVEVPSPFGPCRRTLLVTWRPVAGGTDDAGTQTVTRRIGGLKRVAPPV